VVVALKLPEVPWIVIVYVPVVAELLAVSVSVLVLVVDVGLNAAVTPEPIPVAVKATLPVKPPASCTVIVVDPLADRSTVKLVGEAVSVKLPVTGAVTVSDTEVVSTVLPEVPVTVMV
jgi:hypothetical protein